MKRVLCLLLTLLLLLAGCAQKPAAETTLPPAAIAAAISSSQSELPAMKTLTAEDPDFSVWLSDYYLLPSVQVRDGAILYAGGVEASEIAVLELAKEEDGEAVEEALLAYIRNRTSVFEGYAPQQAALVKNAAAAVNGRYAALFICPEPSAAKAAFLACFEEDRARGGDQVDAVAAQPSVPETAEPAEAEDAYDAEAILQAWRTGDSSALSERNRRILDAAADVIASEIDNDMSDYEKELAIHDYITGWSSFDYSVFGRAALDAVTDGSDTPYGVLINQSAMCHGYSAAFQLLMDMLDIECMTVYGIPGGNGVEHSWNMVNLDGEWYCVDCAWDDPIGGSPGHTYFNVTSDTLRKGGIHRWDESAVPEAAGTTYAYGNCP